MNNKLKVFFAKLLAVVFISGVLYLPLNTAVAQESFETFTIKLAKHNGNSLLLSFGKNIRQRFLGAEDSRFSDIYSFESNYSLTQLKSYLAGDYVYLEPAQSIEASGVVVNDPGFTLDSQNIDKQWGLIKTGFNSAWEKTVGSANNVVGVIDTGIDETHQDLSSINFISGFDFINNKVLNPGTNSDDNGHGTLVSGVLGATPNNGIGIVGTNWQISLMPLKALDATGKGDSDTLAEAIVWATDHGAQFLNLSVGGVGFGHDTSLANAVTYAFNKNVLLVAAAGNDTALSGQSLDANPIFPICDDNNFNMILGVTATDQNDIKPDFANYGKNCIDVTAPGKRVLSTINYDPLTKKPAPNSYAYASGTSLAVPFVVGQAALIKSLYPNATNIQIRDRIISTADSIDNINLSQCSGNSCRGLLGVGRINVPNSLIATIASGFMEKDLIKVQDTGAVYQIQGGQKRLVSPFVLNQQFAGLPQKAVTSAQLSSIPEGSYVTPVEGTLVKYDRSPVVYIISNGQKLPVTYEVFKQRNFSFANVNTLSVPELDSWTTGSFLPPIDGTLLRTVKNKTVYWAVGGVLHAINYGFYMDRGLNVFPVITIADADINGYPKAEAYIR